MTDIEWNPSRCLFTAYMNMRNDIPKLKGAWLSDEDVVRLLQARYDICRYINITPLSMNKHFTREASKYLGTNFDRYPLLNDEGHYRIWRRVKKGLGVISDIPMAFYFAAADEEEASKLPIVIDTEYKSDKLFTDSRVLTNQVLHEMRVQDTMRVKDEVAFRLSAFNLPHLAMLATNKDGNETEDGSTQANVGVKRKSLDDMMGIDPPKRSRRKPGPKAKPKVAPEPKVCRGWSGQKYDEELIRRSLIVALENQEGALIIPEKFDLRGPKNFIVRYDPQKETSPFIIYSKDHDPENCPIDSKSYKHCTACAKASGRLRTYRYLKKKNNRSSDGGGGGGGDEDDDEDDDEPQREPQHHQHHQSPRRPQQQQQLHPHHHQHQAHYQELQHPPPHYLM